MAKKKKKDSYFDEEIDSEDFKETGDEDEEINHVLVDEDEKEREAVPEEEIKDKIIETLKEEVGIKTPESRDDPTLGPSTQEILQRERNKHARKYFT